MDNVAQPEMVTVAVKIPRDLDRAVEIAAAKHDITKQQLFADALRKHLRDLEEA